MPRCLFTSPFSSELCSEEDRSLARVGRVEKKFDYDSSFFARKLASRRNAHCKILAALGLWIKNHFFPSRRSLFSEEFVHYFSAASDKLGKQRQWNAARARKMAFWWSFRSLNSTSPPTLVCLWVIFAFKTLLHFCSRLLLLPFLHMQHNVDTKSKSMLSSWAEEEKFSLKISFTTWMYDCSDDSFALSEDLVEEICHLSHSGVSSSNKRMKTSLQVGGSGGRRASKSSSSQGKLKIPIFLPHNHPPEGFNLLIYIVLCLWLNPSQCWANSV